MGRAMHDFLRTYRALGYARILKHPRFGRRVGWHRDFPNGYMCTAESSFARAALCLDGMTEASGAIRFIPGSHAISDADARHEKADKVRHGLDDGAGVAADCEPGDVLLIHPKVLHGSPMNTTRQPRRNIILQAGTSTRFLNGKRESITGQPL